MFSFTEGLGIKTSAAHKPIRYASCDPQSTTCNSLMLEVPIWAQFCIVPFHENWHKQLAAVGEAVRISEGVAPLS
jgi:hypothetical protein